MKIFIDTANLEEIRTALEWGVIDGVTTNPTLIAKEGKKPEYILNEISKLVDGPISVEIMAEESNSMIKEAEEIAKRNKNFVMKIPMTTEGLKAVRALTKKEIKTNVTLVFTPIQALFAAKAGATYVSPFIGRLDDISHFGMDIIKDIATIFKNYGFKTKIIVASIRNPLHVLDAALIGADVATVPFKVIEQLTKHPLTDIGIKRFKEDWEKVR
ncbi:MAG: fructose-6-phosphate aldolase [Candidatus Thermoplasmatota archaeon]